MVTVQVLETPAQTQTVKDEATGCCMVGGGPPGAMLALLLARRGVRVTLLEMHHDFDREFGATRFTHQPSRSSISLGSQSAFTNFATARFQHPPCSPHAALSHPLI
jgi:2-polyprenyl-6-methoxyphenol hydroxylase-like FAD-dependent oxidoreductase